MPQLVSVTQDIDVEVLADLGVIVDLSYSEVGLDLSYSEVGVDLS